MFYITPLRYPGGKRKLYAFFSRLISYNNINHAVYAEPYAGGAGLALMLLFGGDVNKIYINDINRSIYSFWYATLNNTDELCRLIYDVPVTVGEWHKQKEIQRQKLVIDDTSLGFSTLFLNRVNRSGILNAGVIGGIAQAGKWKLDARFNKKKLIEQVELIATKKNSINISCLDACEFLKNMDSYIDEKFMYYLDPPYIKNGHRLYENFYGHDDHKTVFKAVKKLKNKWVVSYDNHELAHYLYNEYLHITYNLNYSAQQKTLGAEFMAFSCELKLPPGIKKQENMLNMHNINLKAA